MESTPDAQKFAAFESRESAETHEARSVKVVVILNPVAGRGAGNRARPKLEASLARLAAASRLPVCWQVIETSARGDGIEIARRAASDGADVVAAAGGDGNIGEVANGLAGTRARLGIIPLGTGNDFARALGLHGSLDLAVRTLVEGRSRRIDLGRAGERYFINVAGCGFDAVVASRVNRGFRLLRGTAAYVAAVLLTLMTYRPPRMRIIVDGEQQDLRAMLCCIANSTSYGGGMRIAPDARIDDGLLDVCILKEAGAWEFLRAFPRVFRGTHTTHPKFSTRTAPRVIVMTDRLMPVLIDGEAIQLIAGTPITFEVVPKAIEVMMPQPEWVT